MHEKKEIEELAKTLAKLSGIIAGLVVLVCVLTALLIYYLPHHQQEKNAETPIPDQYGNFTESAQQKAKNSSPKNTYWHAPDITGLEENSATKKIIYGKDLIAHTSVYFGMSGKITAAATNGMNCQNCHLDAGTREFGNNYSAVASTYPKYRARSGAIENIYKRVNDCFERSLNGKALDTNSNEMQAIVSYINWLGKDIEKGKKPLGSGFKDLAFLNRAADPEKGKTEYNTKCQSCHQKNGEGILMADKTAYAYPPLWGKNSYNDGAGLYRLSAFAKFIKCNMPWGATHLAVQLSDEEAWDIAAFVNSQPRPKKDIKKDWPKIEEKPIDHPFGPYIDPFSEKQHKYGPFTVIADFYKKRKNK